MNADGNRQNALSTGSLTVEHETKFGGVYLQISIADFLSLGFEFGDSLEISFDNGYSLSDVPFYNGYYTKTARPLVCGYPGYPYIDLCENNGRDLWDAAGLTKDSIASVTLGEKGRFMAVQQAMNLRYSCFREDFDSDIAFANFRALSGGKLKKDFFFRSASPCDDQYGRAETADRLMRENGVRFILNLADSKDDVSRYEERGFFPGFQALYAEGNVALLDLSANYKSDVFKRRLADGLRTLIRSEGPYLTHCTEGKDRTGFVCALLEALADASYAEIAEDYMITYDCYYGVKAENDPEKYLTIRELKFDGYLRDIAGVGEDANLEGLRYAPGAKEYLRSCGMTGEEIGALLKRICDP